jgi:hypothetical protein
MAKCIEFDTNSKYVGIALQEPSKLGAYTRWPLFNIRVVRELQDRKQSPSCSSASSMSRCYCCWVLYFGLVWRRWLLSPFPGRIPLKKLANNGRILLLLEGLVATTIHSLRIQRWPDACGRKPQKLTATHKVFVILLHPLREEAFLAGVEEQFRVTLPFAACPSPSLNRNPNSLGTAFCQRSSRHVSWRMARRPRARARP